MSNLTRRRSRLGSSTVGSNCDPMPQDLSVSGLRSAYLAGSLKPSDVISSVYSRLRVQDGIFVTLTPLEDAKSRCRCFEASVLACTCKLSPSSPATFPRVRTDFQCHCMSSRCHHPVWTVTPVACTTAWYQLSMSSKVQWRHTMHCSTCRHACMHT